MRQKKRENPTNSSGLFVAVRLYLVVLQMLFAFLAHLSVRAPTEQEKCDHDQDASDDCCE